MGRATPLNTRKPVEKRPKSTTVLRRWVRTEGEEVGSILTTTTYLEASLMKSSLPSHRPQIAFGTGASRNRPTRTEVLVLAQY